MGKWWNGKKIWEYDKYNSKMYDLAVNLFSVSIMC